MRKDTKLARIRKAMATGDWDKALSIASRFQRLGEHTDAIKRASDAINNPAFYEQLGYDIAKLKAEGIEALKERYDKSWEDVQEQE